MKVISLMENSACREELYREHGLSLYIESGHKKILFDVGQSEAFAENAGMLGTDLEQVDFAVLSHGHYDHGGGLSRFLQINSHAPVYVSRNAFGDHFHGEEKYIGLDQRLKDNPRLRFVDDRLALGETMTLFGSARETAPCAIRPFGLTVRKDGRFFPETFDHEQYFLVEENGKRILFSGCSHRGILNIMHWFRPDVLVGGFHFMKLEPDSGELRRAAEILRDYPTVYYTGHCTGEAQYSAMKQILGDRLHGLAAGTVLEI